jgi:hypothetical protein
VLVATLAWPASAAAEWRLARVQLANDTIVTTPDIDGVDEEAVCEGVLGYPDDAGPPPEGGGADNVRSIPIDLSAVFGPGSGVVVFFGGPTSLGGLNAGVATATPEFSQTTVTVCLLGSG